MRDLKECTAEVFRRSEQKIKERRRKRGRVLAVCVPICLAAAVWPASILLAGKTADNAPLAEEMAENTGMNFVCPYTEVEIQDGGLFPEEHYGKVADRAVVAELFEAVSSLFADTGGSHDADENLPANENYPAYDGNVGDCQDESASRDRLRGCTVIFTAKDGSQAVYRLVENTLVNVSANETVFLSDAQTAGLMAVLGISE